MTAAAIGDPTARSMTVGLIGAGRLGQTMAHTALRCSLRIDMGERAWSAAKPN